MSNALRAFVDPFARLAENAAPAVIEQLNLAIRDTEAVLGRALIPVVESARIGFERIGDMFARFEPMIRKVANAVGLFLDRGIDALAKFIESRAPTISFFSELIVGSLDLLGKGLKAFLNIIQYHPIILVQNALAARLGFGKDFKNDATGKNAGYRDVTITNSGEDFLRRAQEIAFKQTLNAAPEKTDIFFLEQILTILQEAWRIFQGNKAGQAAIAGGAGQVAVENAGPNIGMLGHPIFDILGIFRGAVNR